MIEKILENSGTAEVLSRKIVTVFRPLKKAVKRKIRSGAKTNIAFDRNETRIKEVKNVLAGCGIEHGDIVIIHSSLDGLSSLGLSADEIVKLILEIFSQATIVFAAYPIEPLRKKDIYKYNPDKTLCWTGILPNCFLKREGVVRSEFPYNSLGAIGREAEAMMAGNLNSVRPHDQYSAWEYCRKRHAKILFLGTTSRESNTMAIHMVPDKMGDRWPIRDWYEKRTYAICLKEREIVKEIQIQNGFWYRYVNEYKTNRILKENRFLRNISVSDIPIEIVDDSYEMMEFLIRRCEKGKLMYRIPKKYYR